MKKGIVIGLAIAVVFLFVGCGVQNQLAGTKWQMKYTDEDYSLVYSYEFKESGYLFEIVTETYEGESETSDPKKSKWFCVDNMLFIEDSNFSGLKNGCYLAEIKKDELLLTVENANTMYKLTKVK